MRWHASRFRGWHWSPTAAFEEGMRRLDEATTAAVAGEIADARVVEVVCCHLIDACRRVRDFDRAGEWCRRVEEIATRFRDADLAAGGLVTGIRRREAGRRGVVEQARIVVGADGRHSLLAKAARAGSYGERPALTFAYYTYWEGLPLDGGEIYGRERRLIGAWPTNDGQLGGRGSRAPLGERRRNAP